MMEGYDNTNPEEEEDDEMADLFSFGADIGAPVEETPTTLNANDDIVNGSVDSSGVEKKDSPVRSSRYDSDDAFLDFLESEDVQFGESFLDNLDSTTTKIGASTTSDGVTKDNNVSNFLTTDDKTSQDIMNWLDEDDSARIQQQHEREEAEEEAEQEIKKKELEEEKQKELSKDSSGLSVIDAFKRVKYSTLQEALESPKSKKQQICKLFVKDNHYVSDGSRPLLWCRMVCGKTLEEVDETSLADSFQQWYSSYKDGNLPSSVSLIERQQQSKLDEWIKNQSAVLSKRVVNATNITTSSVDEASQLITALLKYHYHSSKKQALHFEIDPLLPTVICTILSAGLPLATASVLLSHLQPSFMPILALRNDERFEAAKILHTQFYLLACYHLPLLVYHLDKHLPGWLWPKRLRPSGKSDQDENPPANDIGSKQEPQQEGESITEKARHLEEQGVIPQSWFTTHLAGESDDSDDGPMIMMDPKRLLALWDVILCNNNNSLRFFLVLAILEKYSDQLILLTGEALVTELNKMFQFNHYDDHNSLIGINDWVHEWLSRAQALRDSTPESVVDQLRKTEDDAVTKAIQNRKKMAELRAQQRLEAEARAHKEAQERKADEARLRLTRARLVAFYRKYNPEKECNVDKIMETFQGRFEELDAHLKYKYGVGFNPALKPKSQASVPTVKKQTNLLSIGRGKVQKEQKQKSDEEEKKEDGKEDNDMPERQVEQFAVNVQASEILPFVCWTKEAAKARGAEDVRRKRLIEKTGSKASRDGHDNAVPMKFYIIDSRTEDAAREQGKFPTASCLSPDALLDPIRLSNCEETYESLRGGVHICVMGEGISAIPTLYGQKLTPKLQELMTDDESRTHNCALFFFKRGFPFVSILDGGFAAAHAWLKREGTKNHLDVHTCLVDYKSSSLFGQMEVLYQEQQKALRNSASNKAGDKPSTTSALQNLLDNSMTSLTRNAMRIESMAGGSATEASNLQGRRNFRSFFNMTSETTQNDMKKTTASTGIKDNTTNESMQFPSSPAQTSKHDIIKQLEAAKIGSPSTAPKSPIKTEEGQNQQVSLQEDSSNTSSSPTPSRAQMFLGGWKQVAPIAASINSTTSSKSDSRSSDTVSQAPLVDTTTSGIRGLWGRQRNGAAAATSDPGTNANQMNSTGVFNRFGGLGSALNNKMKAGAARLGEAAKSAGGSASANNTQRVAPTLLEKLPLRNANNDANTKSERDENDFTIDDAEAEVAEFVNQN